MAESKIIDHKSSILRVRPLRLWHVWLLSGQRLMTAARTTAPANRWRALRQARLFRSLGPAGTILAGWRPLACGGIIQTVPGVGEAWAIVGRAAAGRGFRVTRTAQRVLWWWLMHGRWHRVSCSVAASDEKLALWARALGFGYETTLRAGASDGGDVHVLRIHGLEAKLETRNSKLETPSEVPHG